MVFGEKDLLHNFTEILFFQVSMETKMATVDKAEGLLEKLCSASWDAAVQGSFFYALNHSMA